MFEWKLEEMKLLNEKGGIFFGGEKIYNCEHTVSREDKIAFVDKMQDGKLSYLLSLIDKFNEDLPRLCKDRYGYVKSTSLIAWIKRNDIEKKYKVIDYQFNYGQYRLLGIQRFITRNRRTPYDTYDDLVDEAFHRQLKECKKEEYRYFLEHDEYSILVAKVRQMVNKHATTFGVRVGIHSSGKLSVNDEEYNNRPFTMEELKLLYEKYEQLENFITGITNEIKIVY